MVSEAAATSFTGGDPRAVYEIQVEGDLDQSWEGWFDGLTIKREPAGHGRTMLIGSVADQPALRGLLCRLWDLNLTIVSVRRMEMGE